MKGRNVAFGLILIALGVIWILSNMNIIFFNFFDLIRGLFDLWPLILIVIGINIIFKNKILNIILWIIFIVIVIVYGFFINDTDSDRNHSIEEMVVEINEGTKKGELNLDLGAAEYSINSLDNGYALATISSSGNYDYNGEFDGSSEKINISNDLSNNFFNNKNNINIDLNFSLPWNIDIDTGASSGELNLERVKVQNLDLDLGAGKVDARFGTFINHTTYINIESGASSIVLNVPNNAGLKIEMDGALNSTNIDDLGLVESEGDVLISKDYMEREVKFDIKIDMGVGNFKINRY